LRGSDFSNCYLGLADFTGVKLDGVKAENAIGENMQRPSSLRVIEYREVPADFLRIEGEVIFEIKKQ